MRNDAHLEETSGSQTRSLNHLCECLGNEVRGRIRQRRRCSQLPGTERGIRKNDLFQLKYKSELSFKTEASSVVFLLGIRQPDVSFIVAGGGLGVWGWVWPDVPGENCDAAA